MAAIKEWNEDFDFKTTYGADSLARIFLKRNIMISSTVRPGDDTYEQDPIREDENYNLMIWCGRRDMWCPIHKDIQQAYVNFIAEKELLGTEE